MEKYLPIGTLVLLKNANKKIMIIGFYVTSNNDNKVYDYVGCLYPEGLLSSDQSLVFNHDQIDKILHLGIIDDEEKEFKKKLNELVLKENK